MDYSQLSDFEINKLVANATGTQVEETYQFVNGGEDIADHMSGIVLMRKITSNRKHWKLYDPCNSPADAWPIITGNKINIEWHEWKGGEFKPYALNNETMKSCYDDNPFRAVMIVFLMMKDAKHA
ncbi:DUF2591 family protein [Salmonella enterica]|nr:DUF2591 family protein [Salmonella enterica]